MAAKNEQANVCKLLLSKGADVKAKDAYGSTALSLANRAPASKGTTLLQMTDLHMTETVTILVRELQRKHKQDSKLNLSTK
jgi:ankyrin repeat protein